MNLMTKAVITACGASCAGINYLGTGSGNGETAMTKDKINVCVGGANNGLACVTDADCPGGVCDQFLTPQGTAPMSRFLQAPASCTTIAGAPANGGGANGIAVALDGVAIVVNKAVAVDAPNACTSVIFNSSKSFLVQDLNGVGGVVCTGGCDGAGNYVAVDHLDYLKVLFFGIHHSTNERDCNSDVRRSLVANYANLFSGSPCGGPGCTGKALNHLYRRDDASGTTDTFVNLLAPPSIYAVNAALPGGGAQRSNPFCNAPPVVAPTRCIGGPVAGNTCVVNADCQGFCIGGTQPDPTRPCTTNAQCATPNNTCVTAVCGSQNFRVTAGYSDFLDEDPIRVTCTGNGANNGVQVCGLPIPNVGQTHLGTGVNTNPIKGQLVPTFDHQRTLGLVQVVFPPDQKDVPAASQYATNVCTSGEFENLPCFKATCDGFDCPSGGFAFGGKCFAGVFRSRHCIAGTVGAFCQTNLDCGPAGVGNCQTDPIPPGGRNFDANCIQITATGRCPPFVPPKSCSGGPKDHQACANDAFCNPPGGVGPFKCLTTDCRGANLWLRTPDGNLANDTSIVPVVRKNLNAAFRIHSTKAEVGSTGACTTPTATEQIGCLVGAADICASGYAGRSATDPPAAGIGIKGIQITEATIQDGTYPLQRKLYFNSIAGFSNANLDARELALAKAYADDALMAPIIAAQGFVQLPPRPGLTRSLCQDFLEENDPTTGTPKGCGNAAPTNACLTNPSGIPTQ
jgi:hypothetical protein